MIAWMSKRVSTGAMVVMAGAFLAGISACDPMQAPQDDTVVASPSELARTTATPAMLESRQVGIFDAWPDLWPGYEMADTWQDKVDGSWAWVSAGAVRDKPEVGALYSVWELPNAGFAEFIELPPETDALRIVREENSRLELWSSSGVTLYFDIRGQRLTSTMDEPVATITPPPTRTPTGTITPAFGCLQGYELICRTPEPYP